MTDTPPAAGGDEPPRAHPQDPAEGADQEQRQVATEPQAHPQDPAEGADDSSAMS